MLVTAYFHALAMSALVRTTDWPLPLLLMVGFTTQGRPVPALSRMAASNASALAA